VYCDLYNGEEVTSCYLGDPTCTAACKCFTGFGGLTCADTTYDLDQKRIVRDEMVVNLRNLIDAEDSSIDSVGSWISILESVTHVPEELTMDSVTLINEIASAILNNGAALNMAMDELVNVLGSIDAAMQGSALLVAEIVGANFARRSRSLLSVSDLATLNGTMAYQRELLGFFSSIARSDMVPGQNSISQIYTQFRLIHSSFPAQSLVELDVTSPTTAQEDLLSTPISMNISFAANPLSTASPFFTMAVINMYQFIDIHEDIYGLPVFLFMDDVSVCDSSYPASGSCSFVVTLTNNDEVEDYTTTTTAALFTTHCLLGEVRDVVYDCPSQTYISSDYADGLANTTVTAHCDGTDNVDIVTECPLLKNEPSCSRITNSSSLGNSICSVESYTASKVVCACSLLSTSLEVTSFSSVRSSLSLEVASSKQVTSLAATTSVNTFPPSSQPSLQPIFTSPPTSQPSSQPSPVYVPSGTLFVFIFILFIC
jgi:hypothetical protein